MSSGHIGLQNSPQWLGVEDRESAAATGNSLMSFTGIWRHWGRGAKRWPVLRDVNLEIAPGRAILISGSNGVGKTTMLRIATGILAPDSGTVTVSGITAEANWREYHRRIGFLSAGDRGLYPRLTVRDHLQYWSAMTFVPRAERVAAVEEAMALFNLTSLRTRRADRLSQGQRQRLRLALTFVHRPPVVLLDEPRNSLDGDGLEILALAIERTLARGGITISVSPAGEDEPIACDQAYVLEQGSLKRC